MSKKPLSKDDILAFLDAKFSKLDHKPKKREAKLSDKYLPPTTFEQSPSPTVKKPPPTASPLCQALAHLTTTTTTLPR